MSTFLEGLPGKTNDTTAAFTAPQQPDPDPHTEPKETAEGFSLLLLTSLTSSTTALTEKVAETLAAATTLTVKGVQQVGEHLPQVTVGDLMHQLPAPVVFVMDAAIANSQTLQTLTRVAGSASATAQTASGIASRMQLLTGERMLQVYEQLQQGNIAAALHCGEQMLSELAAVLNAAAALGTSATQMVEDLAALQDCLKADLCQVTGAAGEKVGGDSGRWVAEFLTRAAMPTLRVLDLTKTRS